LVFNRTATLRDTWAKIQKVEKETTEVHKEVRKDSKPSRQEEITPLPDKRDDLTPIDQEITIDDFSKIDMRVAIIREASLVEGSKKLIRLMVDLGEGRLRQTFAGVRSTYPNPEELIGKKVIIVANLRPRQMKFGLSEGMLLSGGDSEHPCLTTFDGNPLPGDKVS